MQDRAAEHQSQTNPTKGTDLHGGIDCGTGCGTAIKALTTYRLCSDDWKDVACLIVGTYSIERVCMIKKKPPATIFVRTPPATRCTWPAQVVKTGP